ncbi:MAG: hypothetical protein JSS82_15840 [Bacteroidetes bacterium]|nr:hypothetical protein [Bacteroidota bacterium]
MAVYDPNERALIYDSLRNDLQMLNKRKIKSFDPKSKRFCAESGPDILPVFEESHMLIIMHMLAKTDDHENFSKIAENQIERGVIVKDNVSYVINLLWNHNAMGCMLIFRVLCKKHGLCSEPTEQTMYKSFDIHTLTLVDRTDKTVSCHIKNSDLFCIYSCMATKDDIKSFIEFKSTHTNDSTLATACMIFMHAKAYRCFSYAMARLRISCGNLYEAHNAVAKMIGPWLLKSMRNPESDGLIEQLLELMPLLLHMPVDIPIVNNNRRVIMSVLEFLVQVKKYDFLLKYMNVFHDFGSWKDYENENLTPFRLAIPISIYKRLAYHGLYLKKTSIIQEPNVAEEDAQKELVAYRTHPATMRQRTVQYFSWQIINSGFRPECILCTERLKTKTYAFCFYCFLKLLQLKTPWNRKKISRMLRHSTTGSVQIQKLTASAFVLDDKTIFALMESMNVLYVAKTFFCDAVHTSSEVYKADSFGQKKMDCDCKLRNSGPLMQCRGWFVFRSWLALRSPKIRPKNAPAFDPATQEIFDKYRDEWFAICFDEMEWMKTLHLFEECVFERGFMVQFRYLVKLQYGCPIEIADMILFQLWLQILGSCNCVADGVASTCEMLRPPKDSKKKNKPVL